jgi:hypothetical protein
MILSANIPVAVAAAKAGERVLDVGGWIRPFNAATHVLDLMPYETRETSYAVDPETPPRGSRDTWVVHDACRAPWPFPDKFFDFSFCSHLLEDVRDPLTVCAELIRVSKGGYIETPSRAREIYAKARFFRLRRAFGVMPEIGFSHHRWFVEIDGTHVRFLPKDQRVVRYPSFFITRGNLGRKMTEQESGISLFWRGSFTFEEVASGDNAALAKFRDATLAELRSSRGH